MGENLRLLIGDGFRNGGSSPFCVQGSTSRWHPDSGEIVQELGVPAIKVLGRIGHELSAGQGASESCGRNLRTSMFGLLCLHTVAA